MIKVVSKKVGIAHLLFNKNILPKPKYMHAIIPHSTIDQNFVNYVFLTEARTIRLKQKNI